MIDDPHKNPEEANSKVHRDKVWNWYTGVARNRRQPGASCIIVHTRWHHDDLIGRLLREEPHRWRHINLPAVSNFNEKAAERVLTMEAGVTFDDGWHPTYEDIGEALWPEYQTIAELLPFMRYKHWWWALFMGQPRPLSVPMPRKHDAVRAVTANEDFSIVLNSETLAQIMAVGGYIKRKTAIAQESAVQAAIRVVAKQCYVVVRIPGIRISCCHDLAIGLKGHVAYDIPSRPERHVCST